MTTQLLIILLLGVSAYAMPKIRNQLEDVYNTGEASSILMPGPVILPGNEKQDPEKCDLCKGMVSSISGMIVHNFTKAEMIDALDHWCNQYPDISDKCEMYVDNYLDLVIKEIKEHMTLEMICQKLGLCPESKVPIILKDRYKRELDKHTLEDVYNTAEASSILMPGPVILPGNEKQDDPNCKLCKAMVTLVDVMLKQNLSEAEMVKALDKICEQYPDISDKCEMYVKEYIDQIVKALENNMTAEMICERLGLCPGSKIPGKRAQLHLMNNREDQLCSLCEYVVTTIDAMLKQNATEQEIKAELEKVCGVLPGSAKQMCTEFVDEYVDPIIQALAQMSPELVCQELGLCKANEIKVRDLVKVKPIKASPQCELCEMIVKELDSLLSENSTQEEIEQALEQVCGLLPSAYKDECDNFVKQYEPAIVQILVNEISPDVICTALQLCGSSRFMKEEMMPSNGNITICSMCETLLGIAKKLVEDNETEADLEKALRLICWYMLPVKQQCDDFINKTIPLIFNELKKLDPDTICKQLKLCPSDFYPNDVRCYLKGRNQCEDPELAKKCGANCLI